MGKFDISKYANTLTAPDAPRDIETITGEILKLKQTAGNAILSIGDRLNEAKSLLSHGEWLSWLAERVEFSESTAQRFMRLAREWRNPSALTDLGATKALTLLALPPEERESFMAENHLVGGEEKTVIDMTTRELEKAIRERDEARQEAELARAEVQTAEEGRAKVEADMAVLKALHESAECQRIRAREDLAQAQEELRALRERPVDVAVETVIDEEAVSRARMEALNQAQARINEIEEARQQAESRRETAEKELAAFHRQLKTAGELLDDKVLRRELRRISIEAQNRCFSCGFEHNCSIHGCAIIRQALKRLDVLKELTERMEC